MSGGTDTVRMTPGSRDEEKRPRVNVGHRGGEGNHVSSGYYTSILRVVRATENQLLPPVEGHA